MTSITGDAAVVVVGGVGLRVEMPTPDLASLSSEATIFTVLQVRDDDIRLYGFRSESGRELFRTLTSVSGVGPRLALAILSFHRGDNLERAIVGGDADALVLVPGVGKKIAQRIVLELKDKLGVIATEASVGSPAALAEVREALKGLGYSAQEITQAVAVLPADGDAPTLLRHALRTLGAREPAGVDG